MIKIYGPYKRKDNREHIILYDTETKTRKTMSYPRYLMEQRLGRVLESDEEVDHIDRDCTNNDIDNLQIIKADQHRGLDARRTKLIALVCDWCGKSFARNASWHRHNKKLGKIGAFCSKQCVGRYGKHIQLGGQVKGTFETPDPEYYYLDKSV